MLLEVVDFSQFVVQEATEEFDVALLRVDRQSLAVSCSHLVVVRNGLGVGFEHAQEDEKRGDHHACATLAGLAVDHYHRLVVMLLADRIDTHVARRQLVVLLHTLEEQGCVHAKREHLLQVCHVVVKEGELANGEGFDGVEGVLVLGLSTEVVDLDHVLVMPSQEVNDV